MYDYNTEGVDGVTEVWEKCGGLTKLGWRSSKNEIMKGLVSYIQDLGFQTEDNGNPHRVLQRDSGQVYVGSAVWFGIKADASQHGDWLGPRSAGRTLASLRQGSGAMGLVLCGGSRVSLWGSGETVAPVIRGLQRGIQDGTFTWGP